MERKRCIQCGILIAFQLLLSGCLPVPVPAQKQSQIKFIFRSDALSTRALDPDEEKISDVSLMIFDEDGNAEECIWIQDTDGSVSVTLNVGNRYHIMACANFGYRIYADHISELEEITYHMTYPDEYREGIPMYAELKNISIRADQPVILDFRRLMAKISLRMDRSRLSEGVKMNVRAVRIGNCPKCIKVFSAKNKVSSHDQCFAAGFSRNEFETTPLNIGDIDKKSAEVSLYMLENMQGNIDDGIFTDSDKTFDEDDPRSRTCSYIEMELEYMSQTQYSSSRNLIYRFYLRENRNNFDIERNCHYMITVRPEDDGLKYDGWRVDKTGITDIYPVSFAAYPSQYISGDIGDTVHIWCEFSPDYTPFDVGEEYMKDDKAEGIYDYTIDADGHGAILTLTGPGRGLIYMEAGDPINDAALFIIEVNLPKDTLLYESPDVPSAFLESRHTQDYRRHHQPPVQDR